MRVQICYGNPDDPIQYTPNTARKRWVDAEKTCDAALVITPQIRPGSKPNKPLRFYKTRYCVTHVPTGLAVAKHITSARAARYIAGALSGVPLPWGKMTMNQARLLGLKLPLEIRLWFCNLVQDTRPAPATHRRKA